MKRLIGILAAFFILWAGPSFADTGVPSTDVLTGLDFNIVGPVLKASPEYQAVPKGIASIVETTFDTGEFNGTYRCQTYTYDNMICL